MSEKPTPTPITDNKKNLINFQEAIDKNWDKVMAEESEKYDKMPKQFDISKKEYVEEVISD